MNSLELDFIKKNLIILVILVLTFCIFFLQFTELTGYKIKEDRLVSEEISEVVVGNKNYNLYIAKNYQDITKGLARFDSIRENEGMLFIFDNPGNYTFFMKDMKFNIDIIFIDVDFKVIKIFQNVKKETYRSANDFDAFKSDKPAKYVIELNQGEVAKNGLKLGDKINIPDLQ